MEDNERALGYLMDVLDGSKKQMGQDLAELLLIDQISIDYFQGFMAGIENCRSVFKQMFQDYEEMTDTDEAKPEPEEGSGSWLC